MTCSRLSKASAGTSLWVLVNLRIGEAGAVVLLLGASLRRVFCLDPWAAVGFIAKTKPITQSQTKVLKTEGNAEKWRWSETIPLVPVWLISRPIARSPH